MFRRFGFLIALVLLPLPVLAQTVLNFPRVIVTPQVSTGIAVVNPTSGEASVTFTAYQSDGTTLAKSGVKNPVTIGIPAGGQIEQSVNDILPGVDSFNGWVQVSSATAGLSGFFFNANSLLTDVDGSAAIDAAGEFVLPLAVEDNTAKTEVTLVNGNSESASATVMLYAVDGSVVATKDVVLSGHSLIRQTLQTLFVAVDLSQASHLRVRSDRPLVGEEVIADFQIPHTSTRRETIAIPGQVPLAALVYGMPQFVTGPDWASYLSIVNGSGIGQEVTITAYREDGTRWDVTANPKRISLAGNSSLKTTLGELFGFSPTQLSTGWIEVRGSLGFLVASIGYGNVQTSSFALVQGLDISRASRAGVLARVAEGSAFFTGFTLVNPGTQKADVDVFAIRPDGTTVGKGSFTVGPSQRSGKLLREAIPASLEQTSGWAFIRSTQPLIATGLFGTANGVALMNVPVQSGPVDFTPRAQNTSAISGTITDGTGGVGQITVTLSGPVNATKTTDASGRYAFTQLPAGDYKVTLSKTGATFFPTERTVKVGQTNVDGVDFQAIGITAADTPSISFISPASTFGGNAAFNVTVLGSGFNAASLVQINGQTLQTLYVSATELRAALPSTLIAKPGVLTISVLTPPPGGGSSNRLDFTVNEIPTNPLIEGRVPVGHAPAGVAIHPVSKIALVTSETDDSVVMIDLKTLKKAGEVSVGRSPGEGIAIDATRNRAIVANVGSNDVWVIDIASGTIAAKIPVGNYPLGVAYVPVTNRAIVANSQSNTVSIIDLGTAAVVATIPVGSRPSEVAVNYATNQAVVTNSVDGTVSVLDLTRGVVSNTIPVGQYPRGVAINSATNTAVVANANGNDVSVINLSTGKVTGTVKVGVGPTGVAIHQTSNIAVVTNSGVTRNNSAIGALMTVTMVNLDSLEVVADIPVGAAPFGVDVDQDAQRAVIVNYGSNDITIVRLPNPTPKVTDIEPKTFPAGGGSVTITVHGTGFLPTSVVTLNGQTLATTFVSSTELRAEIPADLLQQLLERSAIQSTAAKGTFAAVTPLTFDIGVSNPGPGGGSSPPPSNPQQNQIQPQNAVPVLTSVAPTQAEAGQAFELVLNGNNFNGTSIINFGSAAHSPSSVTATSMTVNLSAAEVIAGSIPVSITNPPPGGGTTPSLTFTVVAKANPVPAIASVSPTEVAVGSPNANVTINGSGFGAFTTVAINGQNVPATVSANSITLTLSATLLSTPQAIAGLVTNVAPGGGTVSFTINVLNPVPTINGFTPAAVVAGSTSVDLTVSGTKFTSATTITLAETPVPTQFISSTELRTTVSDAYLRRAGLVKVGVSSPAPGGGLAQGGNLSITSPKPELTAIAPQVAPLSTTAFPVQLSGRGFLGNSTVAIGGVTVESVYESATSINVTVPPTMLAKAGTLSFTVTNPGPGGGTSEAVTLSVQNGVPVLEVVSPSSLRTDQKDVVLTLTGKNFVNGSIATLGDTDLITTFVSATQLKANLPALLPLGKVLVSVRNPLPGGGVSNTLELQFTALLPSIASVQPTTIGIGQVLTIDGANFAKGSTVVIAGIPAATTVVSDKQLTAIVPLDAAPGSASVVVVNPETGGGTSNTAAIEITNIAPVITSLDPATVFVNQAGATVTVSGRGFTSRSTVSVGGQSVTTTFIDQATLKFVLPTPTTTNAIIVNIVNPPPGGGISGPAVMTVLNPIPTVSGINPTTAPSASFISLTVTGANFVQGAVIRLGGIALNTQFVDSSRLVATETLAGLGIQPITVTNPIPGGGISNPVNFEITAPLNPTPVVTAVLPSILQTGIATSLQIQGDGFSAAASVSIDGSPVTGAVITSGSLISIVTRGLALGSHTLLVTNPVPGGGDSNPWTLTAVNRPSVLGITPNLVAPGSPQFTLKVSGTNFVAGNSVIVGGTTLTPSSITPTQITVNVPAAVVAAAANLNVLVSSSGITSSAVNLSVHSFETYVSGLNAPNDIAVNSAGDLFIANGGAGNVLKVTSAGIVTTYANGFVKPSGLAIASNGDLFVADQSSGTVTRVTGSGTPSLFASGFTQPSDIAFDAAGNLFVTNSNGLISKVTPVGETSTFSTISGNPAALAIDSAGNVYTTDYSSGAVYKIAPSGETRSVVGYMQRQSDGLALDGFGNIFVATGLRSAVRRIEASGLVAMVTQEVSGGSVALAFDSIGMMFASSNAQNTIYRFPQRVSFAPQATPFVSRMEPDFAVPGAGFTASILGSGLTNAGLVNFSSSVATASVQNGGTNVSVPVNVIISSSAPVSALTFSVTTPAGVSNNADFSVVGSASITSLSPAFTTAGSDEFILTIAGTNFHSGAFVNFGSTPLTPIDSTTTQIRVRIPTAAVASIGQVLVNVSSASATSNSVNFDVKTPVAAIDVSPAEFVPNAIGVTQQFTAVARNDAGNVVANKTFHWTSSNASVLAIDPATGMATVLGNGNAEISAVVDGVSGSVSTTVAQAVATIVVTPASATMNSVGETQQFTAVLRDSNLNIVSGKSVTWSSTSPDIVSIDGSGRATAVSNGTADITATVDGAKGHASVTVQQTVASMEILPVTAKLSALQITQKFEATLRDSRGNPISGRSITWSSSAINVASIDETGTATALGNGPTTIGASVDGVSASATLTVAQVVTSVDVQASTTESLASIGDTRQFSATPKDSNGIVVSGKTAAWSAEDTTVATVSAAGLATATGNGTTNIRATVDSVSGGAPITVAQVVAIVDVTPSAKTLTALTDTQQFAANPKDARGNPVAGKSITWISGNEAIATVDPSGRATAVANGSSEIRAKVDSITGTATLTVNQLAVRVTISPATFTLNALTDTKQFSFTLVDAKGNAVEKNVVWSSDAPAVATINASGLATSVTNGTTTVRAAVDGVSGTATLNVSQLTASVDVSPATQSLSSLGDTQQYNVVVKDSKGVAITGKTVNWSSDASSVASINASGIASALTNGTSTIRASVEGVAGSATLTVTQAVATIDVSPATKTLTSFNDTQQFAATVKDAKGNAIAGKTATWTALTPSVATIDESGVAVALGNGSTTIRASVDGITASATLSVSQTAASVDVTPHSATITALTDSTGFTAVIKDAKGNLVSGKTPAWTTDSSSIATINGNGLATGIAVGSTGVHAMVDGVVGNANLVVTQVTATVEVSPATRTLSSLNDTQLFTATVKDSKGFVIGGKTIAWGSDTGSVATINSAGLATSLTNGTSTIRASVEGISGAATLTVNQVVASIDVTPASPTLTSLGATQQFAATIRDAKGNAIAGKTIAWTSVTPAVATISESGVANAVTNGSTVIRASVDGVNGSATLSVSQTAASVEITPASATITALTDMSAFSAVIKDAKGNVISGRVPAWTTDSNAIATINGNGVASGAGIGATGVHATVDGVTGNANLTVTQVTATVDVSPASKTLSSLNDTQQFSAIVKDSKGFAISGKTIAWGSDTSSVATINSAAVATSLTNGTSTIRATVEGVSGTASLTVNQVVASIDVNPPSPTLTSLNSTQQFGATIKDSKGNAIAGKTITWNSTTPGVATVNDSGLAATVANGTTTIQATADGITGSTTLTVAQSAASIVLLPDVTTIVALTETATLTPTVKDAQGNVINGKTLTWTVDDSSVATINSSGIATAVGPGSTLVHASVDGASGSARVNVNQAVDSIEIAADNGSPLTATARVVAPTVTLMAESAAGTAATFAASAPPAITLTSLGQTQKFIVTVRDRKGRLIANKSVVWTSDSPGIATINGSGLATAVANGSTTIRASAEGKSGSVSLDVTQTVASVDVAPASAAVDSLGGTKQFTATVKDARNNPIAGRTLTWASNHTDIATVDGSGLATAIATGNATISAAVDGKIGNATLAVGQAVGTVNISPSNVTINSLGGTRQFSVVAKDGRGNIISGKTVVWNSGTPSVATIDAAGLASALSQGETVITATVDGISDTARLRVAQGASLVDITPDQATLNAKNRTQTFSAVILDSNGNPIPGKTFTWTTSDPSVATIDSKGTATAVETGVATITATSEGLSATATLRVARNVSSITVTADGSGSVRALGRKRKFTAVAKDADGYEIPNKTASWSSLTTGVADIDSTGQATAKGNGHATLRATIDGVNADVTLDVDQFLDHIDITSTESGKVRALNRKRQFSAVAKDPDGNPIAGKNATWQSLSSGIADVDGSGVATAKGNGVGTLRATIDGVTADATLDVDQLVDRVELTADDSGSIPALNRKRQYHATAKDPDGYPVTGRSITWSSSDSGKATVDGNGQATAKGNGKAQISATIDGVSSNSDIDIAQVSSSIQIDSDTTGSIPALNRKRKFSAHVKDPDGFDIVGKSVTWTSLTTGLADIGPDGQATAKGNGKAKIRASVDGLSADADMDIQQTLSTVEVVTADSGKIRALNRRRQFTAVAKDPDGNPIAGKTATWSTDSSSVAEIDGSGNATAKGNGSVKLHATIDGVAGEATLDVDQLVDRVDVTADGTGSLPALNRKRKFSAVAKDPDGYIVTGRAVTWSSSDTGKATVDTNGEATAKGNGRSQIRATIDGVSTDLALDILQVSSSIQIDSDSTGSIPALGRKRGFTAHVKDPDGYEIAGKTVNWSSLTTGLADVDASGHATAKGNGKAKLRATVDGISADIDMDIQQVVTTVTVGSAETGKVKALNRKRQFTAIAQDPDGNPIAGKTAHWSTDSTSVAEIDASGNATAKGNGSAKLHATIDGVVGESSIDVEQAVDRVEVSADGTGSLPALNRKRKFSAVAKDPDGYIVTGRAVTWSSSDTGKATVDGSGEATAKGNGRAQIRATVDGVSTDFALDISQVSSSIQIDADSTGSIPALGRKRGFTAHVKDPDGYEISGKSVNWSSLTTGLADVDTSGHATAKGNGKAKLRASVDGISADIDMDIQQVVTTVSVGSSEIGKVKALNRKRQFTATAKDPDGNPITGKSATWSSDATAIAEVDSSGNATAKGNGSAKLHATIDGVVGESTIEIEQGVDRVDITADGSGSIPALNRKRKFTATAKDPDGYPVTGKAVTWSTSDATTADIDAAGNATAKSNGSAKIRATIDGITGESNLDISQVTTTVEITADGTGSLPAFNRKRKYTAKAKDPDGYEISGRTANWSSLKPGVADVDSSGNATAKGNGSAKIRATIDGITADADLDVNQITTSVEVSSSSTGSIPALNRKRQYSATAKDAEGFSISGKNATWGSSSTGVADVSSSGEATAKTNGHAKVRATIDGITGEADIDIQQVTDHIDVTSSQTSSIPALKRKRQFSAVVKDPDGNTIDGKTVTWSSSDSTVASASTSGEATANGNGHAKIRATVDGVTGEASIDIQQIVTAVTVASDEAGSIKSLNKTRQYTATAKDADGNPVTGKSAAWTSTTSGIVDVDSNGKVTSKKKGHTAVVATIDGVAGSVDLDVDQIVALVVVTPATATVSLKGAGSHAAFTVAIKDADGNLIDDKEVTWSTSDTEIASISNKGVADGKKAGIATIYADVDGVRGTAVLTVSP